MSLRDTLADRARRESWRVPVSFRRKLKSGAGRVRTVAVRRGATDWGDLRRSAPFSAVYGLDRGTAVDRALVERFLREHASTIRGTVLEVHDDVFTRRYGQAIERIDVVDIDPRNEQATILADLTEAGSLPPNSYDCVILTQTLQFVSDVDAVMVNVWQSLRPGGSILLSVPVTSRLDPTSGTEVDYWRWTPAGLDLQLRRSLPDAHISVVGLGGLVATIAFLHGLSAEEIDADELAVDDADFPLIACAHVVRP